MFSEKSHHSTLGLWRLTLLVTGNIVGSGIFLLPSALAHFGSISLLAWGLTAFGALMLALVFATLSANSTQPQGIHAYVKEAFGEFMGFQVAYNYWIALWVGNAALVVGLTGYLSFFFPSLACNAVLSCMVNIGIVWALTLLNGLSVRYTALFMTATTLLKLLPLVAVILFGVWFIEPKNLLEFNLSGQSSLMAFNSAASLTLWSFLGLESASVATQHIDNPQRNIPRATILGVIFASVLYLLGYLVIIGIMPFKELQLSTAPYADAMTPIMGRAASAWIAGAATLSCLGALTGWILLQGQVTLAAARDGLFPRIFLKQTQQGVPIVGLIVSSVLMTGLLLLKLNQSLVSQFSFIISLAILASLMPYFFTTMAALMLWVKNPNQLGVTNYSGLKVFTLVLLAGVYSFWMMIGAGQEVVFYGFLLWLTSVPAYVALQWTQQRHENEQ